MAPMAFDDPMSLKRNSTTAKLDTLAAKKRNHGTSRHHKLTWQLTQPERDQAAPLEEESVDILFERAIAIALEAVGFAEAEPRALQAYREVAEEYMRHMLADVRQSMLASRRTKPIPEDMQQALHTHQLLLTSLLPHLDPPVSPNKTQISLSAEPVDPALQDQHPSLEILINGDANKQARSYVPKHFPAFPSEHTYKATPHLPEPRTDPRSVRELANEEARLGEAALRKLVGARSDMNTSTSVQEGKTVKSMREKRDEAWKEAMQAAMSAAQDASDAGDDDMEGLEFVGNNRPGAAAARSSGFLSTSVNASKKYWRRPVTRQQDKPSMNGAIS